MSPQPQAEPRFFFGGHAIPVAGRIRRPRDYPIMPVAANTVPVTGGRAESRVGRQTIEDLISFDEAYSSVDGDYEDRAEAVRYTHGNHADNRLPTRTVVQCGLRGLSIVVRGPQSEHRLTADHIEVQITSRGRVRGVPGNSVTIDHAILQGLALDGHGLYVDLRDKMFSENDTKDKLCRCYETDENFFRESAHMFIDPGPRPAKTGVAKPNGRKRKTPEAGGIIACTLISKIDWTGNPHPEAKIAANRITFPDFGVIYLGECTVTLNSRRVTMMRINFGSPDGGDGSFGEAESNGIEWPPANEPPPS
jgi:hypothetical protein